MNDYKHIGKDFVPPDVVPKVTGKAKYAEDFRRDGMVFARLLTSPMAHGRVTNIDTSALDDMNGIVGIITAALIGDQQSNVRFAKGAVASVRIHGPLKYASGELYWHVTAKSLGL